MHVAPRDVVRGGGNAEGNGKMKDDLGGKGAGLALWDASANGNALLSTPLASALTAKNNGYIGVKDLEILLS